MQSVYDRPTIFEGRRTRAPLLLEEPSASNSIPGIGVCHRRGYRHSLQPISKIAREIRVVESM